MSKSFQLYLEVHYYNEIHCININGDICVFKNSTHVFSDDFWVCLTKNEVKKPVEPIVLFLFKIYNF